MIQFHQSYSYEDFIQGYRPNELGKFDLKNGIFYSFCQRAQNNPGQPYFFIIDEINRGNLGKIFGELMLLMEHDKRGPEYAIPLTYAKTPDMTFYIPANLHLVGTMNTADRSLAMVDYALRRRFSFINMEPQFENMYEYLVSKGASTSMAEKIRKKMTDLNDTISRDLGKGFAIGHSYFCGTAARYDENWYQSIVENEIHPLLNEYWFDDETKVNTEVEKLLK
jgi:5-methylcytosine-specific restriction protein B